MLPLTVFPLLRPEVRKRRKRGKLLEKDECPLITLYRHEDFDKGGKESDDFVGDEQEVTIERRQTVLGAIPTDQLREYFVNKLVQDPFSQDTSHRHGMARVPTSYEEYLTVLEPVLAEVNPFCRFTKVLTPCFQKRNKRKDDLAVRNLSVELGCQFQECTAVVYIQISNPSGDVSLYFRNCKTSTDPISKSLSTAKNRPDDSDSDEGNDEVEEIITLDHSGKLRDMEDLDHRKKIRSKIINDSGAEAKENHEGENNEPFNVDKEATVGEEDDEDAPPTDYVIKLPANIVHDERLPNDVLNEYFISKLNGEGERRRSMPDSNHLMIVRPIVAKYNPNCVLKGFSSKVLRKVFLIKIHVRCRRPDCDFHATCVIDGNNGDVCLEFKNASNVYYRLRKGAQPSFCYVRHEKDLILRQYVRKFEREWYYKRIDPLMTSREVAEKFGLKRKFSKIIRREARIWRQEHQQEQQQQQQNQLVERAETQKGDQEVIEGPFHASAL